MILRIVLFLFFLSLSQTFAVDYSGTIESRNYLYFIHYNSNDIDNYRVPIQFRGKLGYSPYDWLLGKLELKAEVDPAHIKRSEAQLKELYLDMLWGKFDLRFGRQIFAWGSADSNNPTDLINPFDLRELLQLEKMGVYSIRLDYLGDSSSLSIIFVPIFEPSLYPSPEEQSVAGPMRFTSRWFPSYPVVADVQGRATPVYYIVEKEEYDLFSPRVGIRYTTTLDSGWDLSGCYLYGKDTIPTVATETSISTSGAQVVGLANIKPLFPRFHMMGVDAQTVFAERITMRAEAAYVIYQVETFGTRSVTEDDYLEYNIGGDYSIDGFSENHSVMFNVQFIHRIVTKKKSLGQGELVTFEIPEPFELSLLKRTSYEFSTKVTFHLTAAFNLDNLDIYVNPELEYKIIDNFKLRVGADFFNGKYDSFFGSYSDNDRVYLFGTYFF